MSQLSIISLSRALWLSICERRQWRRVCSGRQYLGFRRPDSYWLGPTQAGPRRSRWSRRHALPRPSRPSQSTGGTRRTRRSRSSRTTRLTLRSVAPWSLTRSSRSRTRWIPHLRSDARAGRGSAGRVP